MTLSPHLLLVPMSWKGRAIPLLPLRGHTACTEPQCLYNGALYLFTNGSWFQTLVGFLDHLKLARLMIYWQSQASTVTFVSITGYSFLWFLKTYYGIQITVNWRDLFDLNSNLMHFSLFIIFLSYSSTCFEPYCAHHQEDLLYIHSIWFFMCHSSYVTVQCTGSALPVHWTVT